MWSKKSFFNFTAVRYSLHKCSETILWLKRQFTVHVLPIFCALEFMKARKICYRVVQSGQFHTLESFATKIVSSRLPRHWSSEAHSVTLLQLHLINQMQLKGAIPTAKRVVMVFIIIIIIIKSERHDNVIVQFRIYNRHVELLLTYWY